ncbi:MAG TPA: substrate-binding domain-containing protein [Methylomirabilota bacterium]
MSSVSSRLIRRVLPAALVAASTAAVTALAVGRPPEASPTAAALRVCADPNNLPFSNRAGQGFENALAELIARELGRDVTYTWWPQRRGFIRYTLRAGRCDVVMGVPAGYELTATTRPYYRSSYVFVTRRGRAPRLRSFDDPRLRRLRIGLHLIGDDGANVPPEQALGRRGIVGNVVGYSIYGDYSTPNPPARLIEAVARGEIDVALAWGPLAGYFGPRQEVPLEIEPVSPDRDGPTLPFAYDIAMGVRRDDTRLLAELDAVIARRGPEIDHLLRGFGVPLVNPTPRAEAR